MIVGIAMALLAAWPAGTAWPHDVLQRSVPAKDAHLSVVPSSLRLTFSRVPQPQFVRVQLLDAANRAIALGPLRLDSGSVVADIIGALGAGGFTVMWQVTGTDGHPVRGQYRFTIAPGATRAVSHAPDGAEHSRDTAAAATSHHDPTAMPSGGAFDAESAAYVIVRWVTFTSMIAIIGVVAFRCGVLPVAARRAPEQLDVVRSTIENAFARLGIVAASLLIAGSGARLVAQSLAMHGRLELFNGDLVRGMLFHTTWGRGWMMQSAAALLALVGFVVAQRRVRRSAAVLIGAVLLLVLSAPLSGHAAAIENGRALAVQTDALHVLASSIWIGGLAALLVAGITLMRAFPRALAEQSAAHLVNAFSPVAIACVAVVVVSGVVSAAFHVPSLRTLWASDYGRTLLWKAGTVALVAVAGAYNWRVVRPRLNAGRGLDRLRVSASLELAVAVLVIALTAVVVATPPPVMAQ